MGNTSCDVDSAIGAICLAYYYETKLGQKWTPIINCKAADFFCNLEIVLHLKNCNIEQSDLVFYDEFRAAVPSADGIVEMALVDHNILDTNQSDMGSKVTRVIDHHVDSGAYADQIVEKQCRLIGSACSLVALMVKEDLAPFAEDFVRVEAGQPQNMAYLLGAAVVLDSYFFKEELRAKKWTDEDIVASEFLMQYADIGQEYWAALNHAKFDVQAGLSLGLKGIFRRDYKCYDLDKGLMGVSVSTGGIATLVNTFSAPELGVESKQFMLDNNLGLFVIIAIEVDDSGNIEKNIMIFDLLDNPAE